MGPFPNQGGWQLAQGLLNHSGLREPSHASWCQRCWPSSPRWKAWHHLSHTLPVDAAHCLVQHLIELGLRLSKGDGCRHRRSHWQWSVATVQPKGRQRSPSRLGSQECRQLHHRGHGYNGYTAGPVNSHPYMEGNEQGCGTGKFEDGAGFGSGSDILSEYGSGSGSVSGSYTCIFIYIYVYVYVYVFVHLYIYIY